MEITTIDAISDTHNRHGLLKLRGGDLLIHSGDISGRGRSEEIEQFMRWFAAQPYRYKVWIPGNHDFGLESDFTFWKQLSDELGLFLLNDSGVTLEGVKIWGSPITPWFYDWAYNRYRGEDIRRHWEMIPEDTEILITHGPPKGILDMTVHPDGSDREGVGCDDLMDRLMKIPSVRLHVFGHIHEAKGVSYKHSKTFVNASSLDQFYSPVKDTPIRLYRDGNTYLGEEKTGD